MATREMLACTAKIVSEFRDSHGRSLAEMERRTVLLDTESDPPRYTIRYGDPRHRPIWQRHEERLIAEVARLVAVMSEASPEAFIAAARIMGWRLPHGTGCYDPSTYL